MTSSHGAPIVGAFLRLIRITVFSATALIALGSNANAELPTADQSVATSATSEPSAPQTESSPGRDANQPVLVAQASTETRSTADTSSERKANTQKQKSADEDLEEVTVVGYRADASTSATGFVTRIIDTPLTISVLPSQFVTDIAATQVMDAVTSIAGVSGQANEGENLGSFAVRGYQVPSQIDGFDTLAAASGLGSTFGLDRIEVIKGPSAVFNGNVPPGGVVNIIYKQPSFDKNTYVQGTYGSWNYGSAEFSSTGPLVSDKIAYLVDAAIVRTDGWVDWTARNEKTILVGTIIRPIESLSLTLNYRDFNNHDQVSSLPISHPGFMTSGLPANTDIFAWVKDNFGPNEPPQQISVSQYLPGGDRYNTAGPQNHSNTDLTLRSASLEWKINDHIEFRDRFMFSSFTLDLLELDNSTLALGPGGLAGLYSGVLNIAEAGWGRENKAEFAFRFDTGPINHQLLVGYQTEYTVYNYINLAVGTPSVDSAGNPWNFSTDGPIMVQNDFNKQFPSGAPRLLTNYSPSKTDAAYLAEQMSVFDNRVRALFGVRYTSNTTNTSKVSDTTPQVGLLYKPFGVNSVFKQTSLFINYSRSFTPSGLTDGFGNVVPPETGTGYEAGIKTDWFDSQVATTLSVFRDDLSNLAIPNYEAQAKNGGIPVYELGGQERAQGVEAEFTWTPTSHFQVTGNFDWLPTATFVSFPQVPQQQGLRFPSTPELAGNLNAKYSFSQGRLNGFYVGGGFHAQSQTRGVLATDWTYDVHIPALLQADGFAGYIATLENDHKLDVRLNVKNLTDRGGFVIDNSFRPNDPTSVYLTVKFSL